MIRKFLILCAVVSLVAIYANDITDDDITQDYMDKELHALIYGVDCSDSTQITPRSIAPKNIINANDKSIIDTAKYTDSKSRTIVFNGYVLYGGIFDNSQNLYLSPDRRISYALVESNTLEIKAICEKQGFRISSFNNGDFGIYLSKNPTKEVAIALNVNTSMRGYIEAFKEIAPFVAKHILGDRDERFAKISLITFSHLKVLDLGTFYNADDFSSALDRAAGIKSEETNLINTAIIKSMKNFTKDNGLKKVVYVITDADSNDKKMADDMLTLTKNLNANITKNTTTNADNLVKIHAFALSTNLEFLKNITKITGGTYNEANNSYDFKKQILTISNDGKPFDKSELGNEIRPSKNHKIYDPDDPNDNPPRKKGK